MEAKDVVAMEQILVAERKHLGLRERQLMERERQLRDKERQLLEKERENKLKKASCFFLKFKSLGFGDVKGPDFVDMVSKQLIRQEHQLPDMTELTSYITRPLSEEEQFPVLLSTYKALCVDSVARDVFRPATRQDGFLQSQDFARAIQNPPLAYGSQAAYHVLWDVLIYAPIRRFLDDYRVRNVRKESGLSTTQGLPRCDSTYYLDNYALFRGEEEGLMTAGGPATKLVEKDMWPYFDSLPYVLGYSARGHRLVLCALYRHGSHTYKMNIEKFNLRSQHDRIRLFLACFHVAKILKVLKDNCILKGVEPDVVYKNHTGKVVELLGYKVKKSFRDTTQARTVIEKYRALEGCPNVERMLHSSEQKNYLVTARGLCITPRTAEELSTCIECVLTALVYLHSKKIMHRDIRWDNVVKSREDSSWLLIDFDDAERSPCAKGNTLMSPMSHAPEISGPHNIKVDIWGVGYLIKTSRLPFYSSALEQIRDQGLAQSPSNRPTAAKCLSLLRSRA